jgi:hypothetical protein
MQSDFTPTGLKIEGPYENDRNAASRDLFKAIIREVYGVEDVIVAHHLTYEKDDKRGEFSFSVVEEIPSADTLIFDHDAAKKLWGDQWRVVLSRLALEPCETRDKLLGEFYGARSRQVQAPAQEKAA